MKTRNLTQPLLQVVQRVAFACASAVLFSIPLTLAGQEESFKPGGKPEARIFTSLNSTFTDGENHTKFDLTRAYFGYSYNFSKNSMKFSDKMNNEMMTQMTKKLCLMTVIAMKICWIMM